VDVPVEVTCNASPGPACVCNGHPNALGGYRRGSNSAAIACTRSGQNIVVHVRETVGGNAFTRGVAVAVADAEITGCRPNGCGSETDSETIRIRR
jgi:hypothetical protein